MTFKMTITHTNADGTTDKIEIENGTYQDTRTLFNFLEPIVNSIYSIEPKKPPSPKTMMPLMPSTQSAPAPKVVKEEESITKPADAAPVEPTKEVVKVDEQKGKQVQQEPEVVRSRTLPLLGSPLQNTFSIAEKLYLKNFDDMPSPSNEKDPLVRDENEPAGLVYDQPVEKPVEKPSPTKGIAQLHCPDCGTATSKQVLSTSRFVRCPKCKVKLFLFALNEVPGKPDATGIAFRANSIYISPKERYEYKQRLAQEKGEKK